jgi:ribonuclease P protein component
MTVHNATVPRVTFPRSHRLTGRGAFTAVFAGKARKNLGPISVLAVPNDLPHPRLGVSAPKRVGGAVQRNRLKRRVREAFRLSQHDLPAMDIVVLVHPHEPLAVDVYRAMLAEAAGSLEKLWVKRGASRKHRGEPGG